MYFYRFAGKALSTVLEDWPSVKSALACDKSEGEGKGGGGGGGGGEWPFCLSLTEQQKILEAQSSTKHLDALTFTLLAKTPHNVCGIMHHGNEAFSGCMDKAWE